MYNTAYGYAPFTPASRAYALAPYRGGMIGADPTAPQSFTDKLKAFGDETSLPGGVQNKYWGLGLVLVGGVWYLHKKRVF